TCSGPPAGAIARWKRKACRCRSSKRTASTASRRSTTTRSTCGRAARASRRCACDSTTNWFAPPTRRCSRRATRSTRCWTDRGVRGGCPIGRGTSFHESVMRALITGVAGFIGSTLAERLLADGVDVVGIDCFTDYYPRAIKERNLSALAGRPTFRFVESRIQDANLGELLGDRTHVFHLAAQAGVRKSWGRDFAVYTANNIEATQVLLEAAVGRGSLDRFVYASSSSVYGDNVAIPMREDALPHPVSPYGVSKLAAEQLCYLYFANYRLPTVSLRYFTVYGPRARPDMGFHRFLRAAIHGDPLTLYGDGEQTRDFTFVHDAVR